MMEAILNSDMLNSDTAILDTDTFLSSLRFTQKHSHSTLTLTQSNFNLSQTHSFSLNLKKAAILNSAILGFTNNAPTSDSNYLNLTQTQSFSLNLKMAAFFNSGHLGFNHVGISQFSSHTHSDLPRIIPTICTQKLIHSNSTWWWQPFWILPSWILHMLESAQFIHSDSTWWWQPSNWILPCWIQTLPSF